MKKTITPDNYLVRPFLTHKSQDFTYVFLGGSNPEQISIDLAQIPPSVRSWGWDPNVEYRNPDGLFASTLYASLQHVFYQYPSTTGSITDLRFSPKRSTLYVVNIAQRAFGEEVRPGSFRLVTATSTSSLYDDGQGRIVSTDRPTQVVGNIFYGTGIAVIQAATGSATASLVSSHGLFLTTSSVVDVEFEATHTIYEHQVLCTIDPGEFNYSMNPSVRRSGTRTTLDGFVSGTMTPYMTTVGLYSDRGELVALAKFPRALKRVVDSQQTVVVRFDI